MLGLMLAMALTAIPTASSEIRPAPDTLSYVIEQKENTGSKTIIVSGQEYRVYVIDCGTKLPKALENFLNEVGNPENAGKVKKEPDLPIMKNYMD